MTRFRFTLRELLLLVLVVGLALGWWVDHSRLMEVQVQLQRQLIVRILDELSKKDPEVSDSP